MHEYNTKRKPLVLREYGRNVQKLVAQLDTIEDKAIRTQQARAILKLMSSLSTCDKQATEYSQKRWDDLCTISDYTLDVESNYPMPTRNLLPKKPSPLAYKRQPIKYRHYGRHVELLIEKATEITSPTEQERIVIGIARLIKNCSSVWNKEKLDNSMILATIQDIAGSKLTADLEKIKVENIFQTPLPKTRTSKTGRLAFAAKTKQAQ
ncbi:MAG: DUF4290 domain-containing protein [Bacteroidota bacterium]